MSTINLIKLTFIIFFLRDDLEIFCKVIKKLFCAFLSLTFANLFPNENTFYGA